MSKQEKVEKYRERIERAVNTAIQYGQVDGSHHKMWVIDQMLRELLPEKEYKEFVEEYEHGEDGEEYEWDTGIAP